VKRCFCAVGDYDGGGFLVVIMMVIIALSVIFIMVTTLSTCQGQISPLTLVCYRSAYNVKFLR
jgi:hypothetical protein